MTEHPADARDRAQIARATSYAIHFRKGPFERYDETADTLDEAHTIADRLNTDHGKHGRRAIVYAITPEGAIPMGRPYKTGAMRAAETKRRPAVSS
jgi:hypothetical protein